MPTKQLQHTIPPVLALDVHSSSVVEYSNLLQAMQLP